MLKQLRLTGSPPRMRGKGTQYASCRVSYGITPAYAGKRLGLFCVPGRNRDHPRVCGEKPDAGGLRLHDAGSPPRMRGKGTPSMGSSLYSGITPAYAGKRRRTVSRQR